MVSLPEKKATPMLLDSILRAAENGISEIVEVIMEMYPLVTFASEEETGNDVFLWRLCIQPTALAYLATKNDLLLYSFQSLSSRFYLQFEL